MGRCVRACVHACVCMQCVNKFKSSSVLWYTLCERIEARGVRKLDVDSLPGHQEGADSWQTETQTERLGSKKAGLRSRRQGTKVRGVRTGGKDRVPSMAWTS